MHIGLGLSRWCRPPASGGVWPPAGAKIAIDLVGNRAFVNGTGSVSIDTLLGSDPDSVNYWDTTAYNAGNLTANGYVSNVAVAAIGALRTALVTNVTVSFQFRSNNGASPDFLIFTSTNGTGALTIKADEINTHSLYVDSDNGTVHSQTDTVINHGAGVLNAVAITKTSTRIEAAANNTLCLSNGVLTGADFPDPVAVVIFDLDNNAALQYITVYDALPSTVGLAALSVAQ